MRRYAIVGPVNVGKSSLFYALTGLYVNAPLLLLARRGGLSDPGSLRLPGSGLRPGGAPGPLLCMRREAAGRSAPPGAADSWAGPAPQPGGGAFP